MNPMAQVLPDEATLRRAILRHTRMTGEQLDKKIEGLARHPMFANNRRLLYHQLARKLKVPLDDVIEFASGYEGPTEEEIQTEENWTLIRELTKSELKVLNARGAFVRAFGEKTTDRGKPKRTIVMMDESGESTVTIIGDLVGDIKLLTPGDLVKIEGITVFTTTDGAKIPMCQERHGDLKRINYGAFDTNDQMLYQTPLLTIDEAISTQERYVTLRGIFAERENDAPLAICPDCLVEGRRTVFRGKPGQRRFCKACKDSVYSAEWVRSKYMFCDDSGGAITAIPSLRSGLKPEDIDLIDPPDDWPYYIVVGSISEKRDVLYIMNIMRLPDKRQDPESYETATDDQLAKLVQKHEVEEMITEGVTPTDEELVKVQNEVDAAETVEVRKNHVKSQLAQLDFSCDEGAVWPEDPAEEEMLLAALRDRYNDTKEIWADEEPESLQKVLSQQEGRFEKGTLFKMAPVVTDLLMHALAKVIRGKVVPILGE